MLLVLHGQYHFEIALRPVFTPIVFKSTDLETIWPSLVRSGYKSMAGLDANSGSMAPGQ